MKARRLLLAALFVLVVVVLVPLASGATRASSPSAASHAAGDKAAARKAAARKAARRKAAARRAAAKRKAVARRKAAARRAARHRRAVDGNLLPNGSFETSTAGWSAAPGSIVLVAGGAVGSRSARVAPARGQTSYFAQATPRTVSSTVAGARYTASAWFRSDRPGKQVCLRLREWDGGRVVGSAAGCLTARSAWRQLPAFSYAVAGAGHELDLYAYQESASRRDSFQLDGVTLTQASPAAAPTTTTAPATTTTASTSTTAPTSTAAPTTTTTETQPATTTTSSTPVPPLPAQTWLAPFRPTSLWSTPLPASPVLDPDSAAKIAAFVPNVRNPNLSIHSYSVAVAVAGPDTPRYSVPCTLYACTLGAFGQVPIPRGTLADPSPDGHLAVWDPATHVEWDLWQARYDAAADRWSASAGAAVSTDTDGIAPRGTAGATAANFPLLGGLVRPEEIAAGHIDHALVFAMPNLGSGAPTCPATHAAGSNGSSTALTEGARLQLDPSLDVDALAVPAWQKTLMRAMQRYGMYLRDQGGSFAIYGENPLNRGGADPWAQVGISTSSSAPLVNVPWSRMRVIAPAASC